jgi:hypothetical protein
MLNKILYWRYLKVDSEKNVGILRSLFIGITADAVHRLGNEGVLEKVTKEKKNNQAVTGKSNAVLFDVENPKESFTKTREILNCADWEVTSNQLGFTAEATSCKLCAMSKKLGEHSPCYIYCINVQEGIIKSFEPDAVLDVKETLWDGHKCIVDVALVNTSKK